MNYTTNNAKCRVDIFKPSGKWYDTIEVEFDNYNATSIHDELRRCIDRYSGMYAVCLKPYHQHSHPVMIKLE